MDEYLQTSQVVDWQSPSVLEQAQKIAQECSTPGAIAKACFEWVRDKVYHSGDYYMEPITWRASDVLKYRTGFCYAKSHLLAALLRANQIPAGFCYQRLSIDRSGAPYCLHGLNAVYLEGLGWYRLDARGNNGDIQSHFTPPKEHLAYRPSLPGEIDFTCILPEPLPIVVETLQKYDSLEKLRANLPDVTPEAASSYGLTA